LLCFLVTYRDATTVDRLLNLAKKLASVNRTDNWISFDDQHWLTASLNENVILSNNFFGNCNTRNFKCRTTTRNYDSAFCSYGLVFILAFRRRCIIVN